MNQPILYKEDIASHIFLIRGQKVMLDQDLAWLYGVETRRLNEQVKRNISRFPPDFMFQLSYEEWERLMSQNATSNVESRGGRRKLPFVFTEHGAVMLASVLSSDQAVQASIFVVRAFIKFREILASHADLAKKLRKLEKRYDKQFAMVFEAIRQLIEEESRPKEVIGYKYER